jgi:hypothetical protein
MLNVPNSKVTHERDSITDTTKDYIYLVMLVN